MNSDMQLPAKYEPVRIPTIGDYQKLEKKYKKLLIECQSAWKNEGLWFGTAKRLSEFLERKGIVPDLGDGTLAKEAMGGYYRLLGKENPDEQ